MTNPGTAGRTTRVLAISHRPAHQSPAAAGGNVALEGAVSRLRLEPSVTSVRWSIVEDTGGVLAAED